MSKYYNWWGDEPPDIYPELTPLFFLAVIVGWVLDVFGLPIPYWVINQTFIPSF